MNGTNADPVLDQINAYIEAEHDSVSKLTMQAADLFKEHGKGEQEFDNLCERIRKRMTEDYEKRNHGKSKAAKQNAVRVSFHRMKQRAIAGGYKWPKESNRKPLKSSAEELEEARKKTQLRADFKRIKDDPALREEFLKWMKTHRTEPVAPAERAEVPRESEEVEAA